MSVPNLDCQTPEFLMDFWRRHHSNSRKRAMELFGVRFPGYVRTMRNLANYASNKATAMQCRLRGDIQTACMYESICDRIYADLPKEARSW